jgi:hypothetical protein
MGVPVNDVRADELLPLAAGPLRVAVPRLVRWLAPDLGDDPDLAAVVADQASQLAARAV